MKDWHHLYKSLFKHLMDFLFSVMLIVLLFPFLLILLIILLLHFKGNPLFVQERVGFHERPFRLYKFRSFKKEGDIRQKTKIGHIIRIASIDELPQLINIIKGEMSFVGPRPLLLDYLPYYSEHEKKRHAVRPGLTGLSQLEVGNSPDWDARLNLDIDYVERQSFLLDFHIFLRTVFRIFEYGRKRREDVEIEKFDEFVKRR